MDSSSEIQPEIFVDHRTKTSWVSIDSLTIAIHVDTNLPIQNMKRLGDMTIGSHMVSNISLHPKLILLLWSARVSHFACNRLILIHFCHTCCSKGSAICTLCALLEPITLSYMSMCDAWLGMFKLFTQLT